MPGFRGLCVWLFQYILIMFCIVFYIYDDLFHGLALLAWWIAIMLAAVTILVNICIPPLLPFTVVGIIIGALE
jgi:hypothetical protein